MTKKAMVPLKDFVSDAFTQIIDGVAEAQNKMEGRALICPDVIVGNGYYTDGLVAGYGGSHRPISLFHFDVAVSYSIDEELSPDAGGSAIGILSASVDIDGGIGSERSKENRIKFVIPVALPRQVQG